MHARSSGADNSKENAETFYDLEEWFSTFLHAWTTFPATHKL